MIFLKTESARTYLAITNVGTRTYQAFMTGGGQKLTWLLQLEVPEHTWIS